MPASPLRRVLALLGVCSIVVLTTGAVAPLEIVHSETVDLGDSTLTASFTDWPIRAHRSLDFTFEPAGGISDRKGTLRMLSPSGEPGGVGWFDSSRPIDLPRHPRARDVWGLDITALPQAGTWRFQFTVEGPDGTSTGTLPVPVGPAPGPPMTVSWLVGMLPWLLLVPLLGYAWIRSRSTRLPTARSWNG
jgi:hypothetical protein